MAAWVELRRRVGAWRPGFARSAMALDFVPVALGLVLFTMASSRPLLASVVVSGAACGLALCDAVKRETLCEPVVFADRAELLELFRHPRLYLPFAGTSIVVGGAVTIVGILGLLAWLEPPLTQRTAVTAAFEEIGAFLLGWAAFAIPSIPIFARWLSGYYRRWNLHNDPAIDMTRLGMLGCFVAHATIARAERTERQRTATSFLPHTLPRIGPVVVVQAESFMDLRRLDPGLGQVVQPAWGRLAQEACQVGRFAVPAWGANTVRTEYAVLSGLPEAELGLDRFNPYESFADGTPQSLANLARRAGYRTVCVHPFDLSFYRRSSLLPSLGFDRMIGPEAFTDSMPSGEWVPDVALGPVIAAVLAEPGPPAFVFVITMGSHGPWLAGPSHPAVPDVLKTVSSAAQIGRYAVKLAAADALIPALQRAVAGSRGGTLVYYGDHQPSLPGYLPSTACGGASTDYAIWQPSAAPGTRLDIEAHDLGAALASILQRATVTIPAIG